MTAFVFGGVEYVVVLILGICMLLVKDFIFWRGSGEKLSFRAYVLGDMPEPPTLGRDKNEGYRRSNRIQVVYKASQTQEDDLMDRWARWPWLSLLPLVLGRWVPILVGPLRADSVCGHVCGSECFGGRALHRQLHVGAPY